MQSNIPRRRVRLIEQIVRAAARQDARRATAEFVRSYYHGVAEDDLAARPAATLAAVALAHLAMGRRRRPGQSLVAVFNPDATEHGFEADCTLVAIVTEDMPFLVDSIGIVFANAGIGVQLLITRCTP